MCCVLSECSYKCMIQYKEVARYFKTKSEIFNFKLKYKNM